MRLAGIDGCRSGWVAVLAEAGRTASARLAQADSLTALLADVDFAVIDMPIGLVSEPPGRNVEPAMRAILKGKTSCVFPTPCRQALAEDDCRTASSVNREVLGKGLSKQTCALFPKMRKVDAVVREIGQSRLREGHPEVSFAAMAGAPLLSHKRKAPGRAERSDLLARQDFPAQALLDGRGRGVEAHDVFDAAALLWSAFRFVEGRHMVFPENPSRDTVGLEMCVIA